MALKINFTNEKVTSITFIDNTDDELPSVVNYSNVFLRDASDSPDTKEKISGMKLISTGSISRTIKAKEAPKVVKLKSGEPGIEIAWDDGNVSTYSESFLKKYATSTRRRKGKFYEENEELWTKAKLEKKRDLLQVNFKDYVGSEKALWKAFKDLNQFGLVIVDNVATNSTKEYGQSSLEKIAAPIGYLKETIHGRYFDVISTKEADRSLSSEHLVLSHRMFQLHQDLLYYQSPPSIKVLEAVKNNVSGGEYIFVDLFAAAQYVLEVEPHGYFALCNVPITFEHVTKEGNKFVYSRPLIVEDEDNIDPSTNYPYIIAVNYSPPNQAPFEYGITSPLKKIGEFADHENVNEFHSAKETGDRFLFRDFQRGLKIFEEYINKEENQYKIRLNQGEVVLFDNRRLAHSRTEFSDPKGADRWFRVGYLDHDLYYAKLRYLYGKYGEE